MSRLGITVVIIVFFVVCATHTELEVHGHGLGPRFNAGLYRIEQERISNTIASVGEFFFS